MIIAGERYDFVLETDQPVGNYWVKAYGLMDCAYVKVKVFVLTEKQKTLLSSSRCGVLIHIIHVDSPLVFKG